ncbi:MAG: HEAT repeat domain-containing protein [Candidatus Heimdallarchaeota archaeon]|nr:HEAT repeat domain-containing protein [Candidatus Heimdallarchaeota archaeon]
MDKISDEKRALLRQELLEPSIGLVEYYPRTWEDSWNGDFYGIDVNHTIYIDADEALEIILPFISDDNPTIRRHAIWLLGYFSYRVEDAIPQILECIKTDSDNNVLATAIYTLGKIGRNENLVLPVLLLIMNYHSNAFLRQAAAHAIGDFGDNARMVKKELLVSLTLEKNTQVRAMVAKSLGQLNLSETEIIDSLTDLVQYDPNSWVRTKAVESLSKIGSKKLIPFLLVQLENEKDSHEKFAFTFAMFLLDKTDTKIHALLTDLLENDLLSDYEIHQLMNYNFLPEDYLLKRKQEKLDR